MHSPLVHDVGKVLYNMEVTNLVNKQLILYAHKLDFMGGMAHLSSYVINTETKFNIMCTSTSGK